MKLKGVLALILVMFALIFTGCTEVDRGDGAANNRSVNMTGMDGRLQMETSLSNPSVFEGGSTSLVLQIRNTRERPVKNFRADVMNTGGLEVEREVPSTSGPVRCSLEHIDPTSTSSLPVRCVWSMASPQDVLFEGQASRTIPVTVGVSYQGEVMPEDTLDVEFRRQSEIDPGSIERRTVTAVDDHVSVTISTDSTQLAEDPEMELDISVVDQGEGRIGSGRDDITIYFNGSLAELPWDMGESTCDEGGKKMKSIEYSGERSELSCTIALEGDLEGQTRFLLPVVEYGYTVFFPTPVSVHAR